MLVVSWGEATSAQHPVRQASPFRKEGGNMSDTSWCFPVFFAFPCMSLADGLSAAIAARCQQL